MQVLKLEKTNTKLRQVDRGKTSKKQSSFENA